MLKGLIIRKEWLDLILDGSKSWEMRSRPTKIRGDIALIEAGSGKIVGQCDIVDSREHLTAPTLRKCRQLHQVDDLTLLQKWDCAWVLRRPLRYQIPVRYTHPMGAVTWVNLDAETIAKCKDEKDVTQFVSTGPSMVIGWQEFRDNWCKLRHHGGKCYYAVKNEERKICERERCPAVYGRQHNQKE